MITKVQYKFLKKFLKISKHKNIHVKYFAKLLAKHSQLNPANPFVNNEDSSDYLEGALLENFINDCYLEEVGLKDIVMYNNSRYEITQKGLSAIDEYRREYTSKIKLPIISICVSVLSIIISIIALFLTVK